MTTADLSSTVLTFVLPVDSHPWADDRPRPRRREVSAALKAAGRSRLGLLAKAPPPGAIGHRTLWAMCWLLFAAALLRHLLFG